MVASAGESASSRRRLQLTDAVEGVHTDVVRTIFTSSHLFPDDVRWNETVISEGRGYPWLPEMVSSDGRMSRGLIRDGVEAIPTGGIHLHTPAATGVVRQSSADFLRATRMGTLDYPAPAAPSLFSR